jgi:hypothetical protein
MSTPDQRDPMTPIATVEVSVGLGGQSDPGAIAVPIANAEDGWYVAEAGGAHPDQIDAPVTSDRCGRLARPVLE